MKRYEDVFSGFNPVITFVFFIGAIVFGMLFIHPAFLICSALLSTVYYFTVSDRKASRFILGLLLLLVFISALNPLFNAKGNRVLFTYATDRPYTFEALCYGMALAAVFYSVIVWFASYNRVMSSDKFLYIFGRLMPSVSMILNLTLRLVPLYQRKALQISSARSCVGMSVGTGVKRERMAKCMTIVSALTSWALEGGIVMADSMVSRGYGSGRRTNFSIYRFDSRDISLLAIMICLAGIVVICAANGGMAASYTPAMMISPIDDPYSLLGIMAYFIFLSIPALLNLCNSLRWRLSR